MISSAVAPVGTLLAGPLIHWLLNIPQPTFIESGYQVVFLMASLMILFIGILARSFNIFRMSGLLKNGYSYSSISYKKIILPSTLRELNLL